MANPPPTLGELLVEHIRREGLPVNSDGLITLREWRDTISELVRVRVRVRVRVWVWVWVWVSPSPNRNPSPNPKQGLKAEQHETDVRRSRGLQP